MTRRSMPTPAKDPLALDMDIDLDAPRATRNQNVKKESPVKKEEPARRASRRSMSSITEVTEVNIDAPRASRHRGAKVPAMERVSPSPPPTPRSTRRGARSENITGDVLPKGHEKAKVEVSREERILADKAEDEGGSINYGKKRGLITPSRASRSRQEEPEEEKPSKKQRFEQKKNMGPRSKRARVSYPVEEEDEEEETPLRPSRSARKKPEPPAKKAGGPKSKRPGPASKKAPRAKKDKKVYYHMTEDNGAQKTEKIEVEDESDDDEVFPTVGPYQCEICQLITDTKKQFVEHIKDNHT